MNEHLIEKLTQSTRMFEGKVINLRVDQVELPGGKIATREIVEHPGAVAVVPIREDGSVIMVKQFRHPTGKVLLEIPAGKLDRGESPDDCALRELEEETGYKAGVVKKLASIYTTPGFTDEIIHIYAATDLRKTEKNQDEDELLDIICYSKEELRDLLAAGELEDAKTLLGLYLAGVIA